MFSALVVLSWLAFASPAGGGSDRTIEFGQSVRGQSLHALHIGSNDAERTLLVIGSIHGDEAEGHEIVENLRRESPDHAAIWLVESANPDGFAANTRKNANGVDLNRNFPVDWQPSSDPAGGYYPGREPFSEPESRALRELTRRIRPDIVISYHQPWNQVLGSCEGPDRVQRRYATLTGTEFACRGGELPGTATKWLNREHERLAFVVELAAGELSSADARTHARAVLSIAEPR